MNPNERWRNCIQSLLSFEIFHIESSWEGIRFLRHSCLLRRGRFPYTDKTSRKLLRKSSTFITIIKMQYLYRVVGWSQSENVKYTWNFINIKMWYKRCFPIFVELTAGNTVSGLQKRSVQKVAEKMKPTKENKNPW